MKVPFLMLLYAFGALAASLPLDLLYQFPTPPWKGSENVAIRPNGQLLTTLASGPSIYQFDPATRSTDLVVTVPNNPEAVLGIAQPDPDIFVVAAGNLTIGANIPGGATGTVGTFALWTLNLTAEPTIDLLTAVPEAHTLNGATIVPELDNTVLFADSGLGVVWSVNTETGAYRIAIQDPLFASTAQQSLGINGIHVQGRELYFTNSAQGIYGKVALAIDDRGQVSAGGAAQVIATGPATTTSFFDDFALDAQGTAWIATHPNAITSVTQGGDATVVAGGGNDTLILGPTSTIFDRDGRQLYIVTAGSIEPVQGGQILALDVCG